MIITGDDFTGIIELKDFLRTQFEMKDLGIASYFLGLKILSDSDGYYLSLELNMLLIFSLELGSLLTRLAPLLSSKIYGLPLWMAHDFQMLPSTIS